MLTGEASEGPRLQQSCGPALPWAMPALCPEPGRQAACGQVEVVSMPVSHTRQNRALPPEQGLSRIRARASGCGGPSAFSLLSVRPTASVWRGVRSQSWAGPRSPGPILRLCSWQGSSSWSTPLVSDSPGPEAGSHSHPQGPTRQREGVIPPTGTQLSPCVVGSGVMKGSPLVGPWWPA